MKIKLNHKGIEEVLKSDKVAAAVHKVASEVASNTDGNTHPGAEVVVDDYVTDRAASSVTVKHASAAGYEAKHGTLSKAASAAGLEVHE